MSFWGELKSRNVYRVSAAYLIVSWLIAQVVSLIQDPMRLPDWFDTAIIVLLAAGFPVALLLAWAYELTPEGVMKTSRVPADKRVTQPTHRKLNYVVIGLLGLAVVFLVVENYLLPDRPQTVTEKSIVVLPFENLSPDPEQDFFADGLSAELLNSLDDIKDLRVTPLASAVALKDTDLTIPEIAEMLDVEYLLRGNVNRSETRLRVSVQILARDGSQLRSIPYDRQPGDILEIQQSIANEVASALQVELGFEGATGVTGSTDDAVAQQLYLSAGGRSMVGTGGQDVLGNLDLIERALERDPGFALAWIRKAELHRTMGLFPGLFASSSPSSDQWALAEAAAQRAVEAAPGLAAAHNQVASIAFFQGDWQRAAGSYRRAAELGVATDWLFRFAVGHIPDIAKLHDPQDPLNEILSPLDATLSGFRVAMLDAAGAKNEALAEYERGSEIFANWGEGVYETFIALMQSPEWLGELRTFLEERPGRQRGTFLRIVEDPEAFLARLRSREIEENCAVGINCIAFAAIAYRRDDPDLAVALLREGFLSQPAQLHHAWRPVFSGLRETDGFKQLLIDIGLVDYWREYGWPSLCEPAGSDDFQCR